MDRIDHLEDFLEIVQRLRRGYGCTTPLAIEAMSGRSSRSEPSTSSYSSYSAIPYSFYAERILELCESGRFALLSEMKEPSTAPLFRASFDVAAFF